MKLFSKYTLLAALLCASFTTANAQGVVIYKKDGKAIKVPYYELDRIDTYDYTDEPGIEGEDTDQDTDKESTLSFTVGGIGFNMKLVKAGTFTMGATAEQTGAEDDEKPAHSVTISKDFYIGETEVTQGLWQAVMGNSPTTDGSKWSDTYGIGSAYPAYYISYNEVTDFITKLNQKTGKQFRMPTEAEWEYAARGGNQSKGYTYSGSNKIDDVAWYTTNSGSKTHPVKTKQANELGIYDMSGNVWEWCSDRYEKTYYSVSPSNDPTGPASGSSRVFRGGSWFNYAGNCRTANRNISSTTDRNNDIGFRLCLSPSK